MTGATGRGPSLLSPHKKGRATVAQSQNASVELAIPATFFVGLGTYGKMMLGDKALEFYNDRNPEDYIQIPWDQIDYVSASVIFKRHISRFAVFTKENGHFAFSTRDNRATLRVVRDHIGNEKVVRSADFLGVVRAGIVGIWHRITRRQ